MAKYLVPFEGYMVVEASSWQHAEIMCLTWRNSLMCRKSGTKTVTNSMDVTSSKNGNIEYNSPEVQAIHITFSTPPFADITGEIEARRETVIENDRIKWQQRGIRGTDWTEEQLIVVTMNEEVG